MQEVLVANMGAAGANSGGNHLGGGVATLSPDDASGIVLMAAFMSEMLALVHAEANGEAMAAVSQGIDVPFQGILMRLDASFEGLDTSVSDGGAQATMRQVTVIISLGLANANSGNNATLTEVEQGNVVNELAAGDSISVMPNVIDTGDATADGEHVVVICQRINAEDVECLKPPETTTVPVPTSTVTGATTTTVDPTTPSLPTTTTTPTPTTSGPSVSTPPSNDPTGFGPTPNGPRYVPQGRLPATS